MKLTDKQKQDILRIIDVELKDFYGKLNSDPEKRKRLGQFYTPGKVCIMMLEKFSYESLAGKTILDPTCGSGNLLIGCLCAGADLDKLYGNEYDPDAVDLCKKRLLMAADLLGIDKSKFRDFQIHRGNALQKRCLTEFDEEYEKNYDVRGIDDLDYAQGKDAYNNTLSWKQENERLNAKLNKPTQLSLF